MTTFLEKILTTKREEVDRLRTGSIVITEIPSYEKRGFASAISQARHGLAVIAEVKKASPSKGVIAENFQPVETALAYQTGGASAISVLTDETYFQGSIEHLQAVRHAVQIPVLRKDFIIDERQIDVALFIQADAILLIAAALPKNRLTELSTYAQSHGLDVLIEVHGTDELDAALAAKPSVLGVNNRNLHTFEVNLQTTKAVLEVVPNDILVISESGVHTADDAAALRTYGAKGLLIGESLMRAGQRGAIAEQLQSFLRAASQAVHNR